MVATFSLSERALNALVARPSAERMARRCLSRWKAVQAVILVIRDNYPALNYLGVDLIPSGGTVMTFMFINV